MASRWPSDNQEALLRFYGTPGADVERQLVPVTPPFKMYYEGKPVRQIMFHKKAADALRAVLSEIWEVSGRSQTKLDMLGVSNYSGAYNPRYIRGSTTKWSNHAYGAAIDIDAEHNGFNTGHGRMPEFVIDAFKRQGARWGGNYHGRTDPMHFEFCDPGPGAVQPKPLPPKETAKPTPPIQQPEPEEEEVQGQPSATSVPSVPEGKPSIFRRIGNWAMGIIGGGGAFALDWRLGFVLIFAFFALIGFLVWLFGREPIKNWIMKHFS